jgi:hypothetical protein
MKKYLLLPILLLLVYAPVVHAQSFDIPVEGYGFSFGNSKNFTGLRINIVDKEVERINGLNLSLTNADNDGEFNGIALGGLVGGDSVNGIAVGLLGVDAKKIRGIAIGGVFAAERKIVSQVLSNISFDFKNRSKSRASLFGIQFENIPETSLVGIQIGYMAAVTRKGFGILASATFSISKEMNGIEAGFVGNFAGEMNGLQVGVINFAGEMNGLQVGALNLSGEVNGIAIGAFWNSAKKMNGLQIGLLNYADELNGIQIGLFSGAKKANGIQIGLFNYIGNNPIGLHILPGINAHFSF